MQYINGGTGIGMEVYPGQNQFQMTQNPYGYSQQAPDMVQYKPAVDPRMFETPVITMGDRDSVRPSFFKPENEKINITVDSIESDHERESKKKRRKSSDNTNLPETRSSGAIVRANEGPVSGTVEDQATIYSYNETNNLLHETLAQIDSINRELVQEFNSVRQNRTLRNKYNILNDLSANIGSLINNRISVIREINTCISKANDMDYKKYKDKEAAKSTMNDDKYISDLYQAFMQNPQNIAPQYQMPKVDPSILGSGIVRANITQDNINNPGQPIETGYLQYVANLTPEQNLMRYENNPDVKQVVVYDAQTGAKFFQYMNLRTGEAIPNVPVYDQMFMEDTTLDLKTRIAKNINLNETFPIVVINDNIVSQY